MTATIVPNDPNMDYFMNARVERRLWGPSSYVPGKGNRRMVATGYAFYDGDPIVDVRTEDQRIVTVYPL